MNIDGVDREVEVQPGTYNILSLIDELNDLSAELDLVFYYD